MLIVGHFRREMSGGSPLKMRQSQKDKCGLEPIKLKGTAATGRQTRSAVATQVNIMTEQPTPETFLPHVNKVFRVKGARHALTLSRVDVRQMGEWERGALGRQSFTLIFGGPPGDVLREGLYTFEVEGGLTVDLYVIPVQTFVRDRQDYQAVFN
jgi:hypothetical protein